jgi:hypothetical protein
VEGKVKLYVVRILRLISPCCAFGIFLGIQIVFTPSSGLASKLNNSSSLVSIINFLLTQSNVAPPSVNIDYPAKYIGVANVTIYYFSLSNELLLTNTFEKGSVIYFAAPGYYEKNTFGFRFTSLSPPGPYQPEGLFDITSYTPVDSNGGNQYWDIKTAGADFEGTLTDTHYNEILPYPNNNMMTALAGSEAMHVISSRTMITGTKLSGHVDSNSLDLIVLGGLYVKGIDDLKPMFHIEIHALKAN